MLCSLVGLCKGIAARLGVARGLWQVLLLSQGGPKWCKRHQKPFWSSLEPPGGKTISGMRLGLLEAVARRDGSFQKRDLVVSLAGVFLIIPVMSWSSDLPLCSGEHSFIPLLKQL